MPTQDDKRHEQIEIVFDVLVVKKILEDFQESFEEADFDDNQIDLFADAVVGLDPEDQKICMAIPFEVRQRVLQRVLSDFKKTGDMRMAVRALLETNKAHDFNLGYHITNTLWEPENGAWDIIGSEIDEREGDKRMAYYALDYHNLYTRHRGKYLYVVRAQLNTKHGHGLDTSNRWGRAARLSVISRIDFVPFYEAAQALVEKK